LESQHILFTSAGFLSTAGPEAPGNYGLLDIIAALKWVNEYIEHFGGNKNNLTFGGFSTGGASVHLLMTSPLAKGIPTLFHAS
jgi:carboxylesterase type B